MYRWIVYASLFALVGCEAGGEHGAETVNFSENIAASTVPPEQSGERRWVTDQRLARHTCPSERCGVVGNLMFREAADVVEEKGGWARVSEVYDASCQGGRSEYVDSGNAECTAENGIVEGRFAEWVKASGLSERRPPDPAETASATEQLVKDSDDFAQHRRAFVKATSTLIADGRCAAADFEEMGGWMKSTNEGPNVYFTYCGGMTVVNRIYVNVSTGEVYQ